ncbi:acyltransferase [Metabacillus halosaccharovorans]|uniref:acyltransferase n=1 Tax=Metabacillus halosaccharovorans TaxID=930124 RepID=UPI0037354A5D
MIGRLRKLLKEKVKKPLYRKRIEKRARAVGKGLKVNNSSYINHNTYLGNNVNFNGMKIAGKGKVIIGDNFHSGEECLMITDSHNYDKGNAIPYDSTYIVKDINIQDNVWLGSRVIILGGVTIEEGAIVQAGSVVVSNIPKGAIYGGHPARLIKYRDLDHYERLKAEGKFH